MEVEQRLARALILFHEKMKAQNGKFTLPITKKDLASYIGTTPESVSRKLLSFISQQLIRLDGAATNTNSRVGPIKRDMRISIKFHLTLSPSIENDQVQFQFTIAFIPNA